MPTVPFGLGHSMRTLTAEDMGIPSYAKALSEGMDLGHKPSKMANELLASMLTNKLNESKVKYADKQAETDIGYKQALMEQALRPKAIGGKISQLEQLRDRFAPGTEQYNQYDEALKQALKGSNGITLFDPNGNPMVQIGGASSSKGKGGQLYQSETGAQYQAPTNAILTQMQNRVVGQKLVEPYLDKVIENLPQFQSGWTQLKSKAAGFANKWGGSDFDLPSQLQTGKASLGLGAEGMLRQFGLNATGHNLERMEQILKPHEDESQEGYKRRALEQSRQFIEGALEAQAISRSGVEVKSPALKNGTRNSLKDKPSENPLGNTSYKVKPGGPVGAGVNVQAPDGTISQMSVSQWLKIKDKSFNYNGKKVKLQLLDQEA